MKINPQECHRTLIKSLVFVLLIVFTQTAIGRPAYSVPQNSGVRERVIEAESIIRFLKSMKENKRTDMIAAFKEGRERGGFPDWMLEYGKNILKSCDENALLFTGSHADTIAAWYLQFVENFREDVTVIPMGLLDQVWFLKILNQKEGLNSHIVKDPSKKKDAFVDQSSPLVIPVSPKVCSQYGIAHEIHEIEWIDKEALYQLRGCYLEKNIQAFLQIIRTNAWKRAVCLTPACNKPFMSHMVPYLQLSGVVFRVLPRPVKGMIPGVDLKRTEHVLLNDVNLSAMRRYRNAHGLELDAVRYQYISLYRHISRYFEIHKASQKNQRALACLRSILSDGFIPDPDLVEMEW